MVGDAGRWASPIDLVHRARLGAVPPVDWPVHAALFAPLGYVIFALTGVYSTFQALRHGGIKWRDTFYPLAELREGLVK